MHADTTRATVSTVAASTGHLYTHLGQPLRSQEQVRPKRKLVLRGAGFRGQRCTAAAALAAAALAAAALAAALPSTTTFAGGCLSPLKLAAYHPSGVVCWVSPQLYVQAFI